MSRLISCASAIVLIVGFVALWAAGSAAGGAEDAAGAKPPAGKGDAAGKRAAQASGEYEFVAPLEAVMLKVDDVYYKQMPEKLKKEDFKGLNLDALFIAEMANLASHYKEHRAKPKFRDLCTSMKDNMLKLADAAKKKDGATAKSLHSKVEETCDSCHEEFRD